MSEAKKCMTIDQHVTSVQAHYISHCASLWDQRKLHVRRNAKNKQLQMREETKMWNTVLQYAWSKKKYISNEILSLRPWCNTNQDSNKYTNNSEIVLPINKCKGYLPTHLIWLTTPS